MRTAILLSILITIIEPLAAGEVVIVNGHSSPVDVELSFDGSTFVPFQSLAGSSVVVMAESVRIGGISGSVESVPSDQRMQLFLGSASYDFQQVGVNNQRSFHAMLQALLASFGVLLFLSFSHRFNPWGGFER